MSRDKLKFNKGEQWSLDKDDVMLDSIKSKMRAEMDKRGITGQKIADHYRDIDESIPATQRANIKQSFANQEKKAAPKPKLQIVKEEVKKSNNDQWTLEKSGYGGPKGKGMNAYRPVDNIKRKENRTSDEYEHVGQNKAAHRWTTMGSSMTAAHQKKQQEVQDEKAKASLKTWKDFSPEEQAEMKSKYAPSVKKDETKPKKPQWRVKVKGRQGWHPVVNMVDQGWGNGNNYHLQDGTKVHQSMIEDIDMSGKDSGSSPEGQ